MYILLYSSITGPVSNGFVKNPKESVTAYSSKTEVESPAVTSGSPWWRSNPLASSARPAADVQQAEVMQVFQFHPPPHTTPALIFWHKAYLPDVTLMTCLICVPKLPWSRTKLCTSPLFKQILSRCVILTHFSQSLFTYDLSFPSSPICLSIPFKNSAYGKKQKCTSCSLVKIFIFFIYALQIEPVMLSDPI